MSCNCECRNGDCSCGNNYKKSEGDYCGCAGDCKNSDDECLCGSGGCNKNCDCDCGNEEKCCNNSRCNCSNCRVSKSSANIMNYKKNTCSQGCEKTIIHNS